MFDKILKTTTVKKIRKNFLSTIITIAILFPPMYCGFHFVNGDLIENKKFVVVEKLESKNGVKYNYSLKITYENEVRLIQNVSADTYIHTEVGQPWEIQEISPMVNKWIVNAAIVEGVLIVAFLAIGVILGGVL